MVKSIDASDVVGILRSDVSAAFLGSKNNSKCLLLRVKVNSVLSKKKSQLSPKSINILPVFLPDVQLIYS